MKIIVKDSTTVLAMIIIIGIIILAGILCFNFFKIFHSSNKTEIAKQLKEINISNEFNIDENNNLFIENGSKNDINKSESNFDDLNSSYTKSEIIELMRSKDNKKNYQVEYSSDGKNKINIWYLNGMMKEVISNSENDGTIYCNFNTIETVVISKKNNMAIKKNEVFLKENYVPDEFIKSIEKGNYVIEKEEKKFGRDAIVLKFSNTGKIGNQVLFDANNFENTDNNQDIEFDYTIRLFVDKESGLLLQVENILETDGKSSNKTMEFNLKLNSVKESDVTIPDLIKYEQVDISSKK